MKELRKVSIVMGVYNPSDLRRFMAAVNSVIRQSMTDWELLLYDDGSAERCRWIIEQAARMDDRIILLRGKKNRGLAYALNACIKEASGEFIARMDDDDLCLPQRLEKQCRFLEKHPKYDWVGSNVELIDDGGVWGYQKMPEAPQKRDFLFNLPYIHPTVMFRREVFEQYGGYCTARETLQCEDYELFMRLHANGCRGYNLQEALLRYREDYASGKKRTYRRRIREAGVRKRGFEALGLLDKSTYVYVAKPLLVGAVPSPVHHYVKKAVKKKA